MTPEGRVKNSLKKLLKGYENIYVHWPVQRGMGAPELDCNIVFCGLAVSIECKAPGEKFTPRQALTARAKQHAGAIVLGYRGEEDNETVRMVFQYIDDGMIYHATLLATDQLEEKGFI